MRRCFYVFFTITEFGVRPDGNQEQTYNAVIGHVLDVYGGLRDPV